MGALFFALCAILNPKKILDLGSGFSSFVFRLYASRAAIKPVTWSVDDASEWLEKTEAFLIKHKVNHENLVEWGSFMAQKQDRFDFVLNDFSNMENRRQHFQEIMSKVSPAGMLFLDDMHRLEYNTYVGGALREFNGKHYSLRLLTKDSFGRYSTLFINCSKLPAT